jgi:hypothetical protein
MNFRPFLAIGIALTLIGCDAPSEKVSAVPPSDVEETSSVATALPEVAELALVAAKLPEKVSFNEHIQPILSEYCYHCHGPDAGTREPKSDPLRLDIVEEAFKLRENGLPVIIKGKPAESLVVELMKSTDPDMIMPPPRSHKELKPDQIALIERWIEQGAEYEAHWSFAPVKRPEPPASGGAWAANPIDHFIAEKLEESGFKPNPEDEPSRFYRRMHLDLTGLPPTPTDLAAFLKSHAADPKAAIDKAADDLLATPASAEHFARHWLDAARYADTHGIHIDNYRAIWPYRDWVIRAFQANMPWDQFTTEQIAGDLLPNRTLDQQVATGFSRCLATTGEGGAIGEEYDAIYAKDRVETVSAIWLGLTTGCAACHDHKFDPVSTKEFYSLTAFFRNTPMSSLDGNKADHPPNVFVPLLEDRERWAILEAESADLKKQLSARSKAARPDFEAWLVNATIGSAQEIDSTLSIHLPLNETEGPIHGFVDGQPREWPTNLKRIDAPNGKAPVISAIPMELGDIGSFSRSDQVSYGGFIRVEGKPTGSVVARMNPEQNFRGWDLYLEAGKPAAHVIDTWQDAATKQVAPDALKQGDWVHVMFTFNGAVSGHQAGTIYVNGAKVNSAAKPNTVGGTIETKVPLRLGSREGGQSNIIGGRVALQDFRFYRRLLLPEEISSLAKGGGLHRIIATPAAERTKEQSETLFNHFIATVDAPSRELRTQLDKLSQEEGKIRARGSVSLVMEEKKTEPFAHVLNRGVYTDKGEKVPPATPAILPPMPADAPKNRIGLARWLNDPANPLPARVTMNRTWYYFFGAGIVESNDDFGIMGARPSHPKLLDWLAAEFVDSKWNYRHMLKLMVTSATYRQSGVVSPEKLEKDPSNKLLARGPRHRLDAEQIRDLALAASGLLSDKTGGPSVKPYQPEGIWEAVAMPQSNTRHYKPDTGDSLYRRSLYTLWKRTAAPASLEIFNAPSREVFCVRRDRTNTPLQALVLLNDPQFVEASRELAVAALATGSDFDARLDFVTLRLIGRVFDAGERAIVKKSYEKSLETFRATPDDALKFISIGEKAPPADADAPELAAWSLLASKVLNLDETITR